jgi:N-acetylmuramoyl-L-alanine amidase
MCRDTNCCAVLTENLFQDNKEDVERLLTVEGLQSIVRVHIAAIERYILEA